jgi:hypothetical protein
MSVSLGGDFDETECKYYLAILMPSCSSISGGIRNIERMKNFDDPLALHFSLEFNSENMAG